SSLTLSTFKVSIGGGYTVFTSWYLILIHTQTCRATTLSDFKPCCLKGILNTFFFNLFGYLLGTRNNKSVHIWCFLFSFNIICCNTKIFNSRVCTATDKDVINRFP